jgi:hypothetical protein
VNCKTCSVECNIYLEGMATVKIMRHLLANADIEMDSNSFTVSLVMNVASVNMEAPESS